MLPGARTGGGFDSAQLSCCVLISQHKNIPGFTFSFRWKSMSVEKSSEQWWYNPYNQKPVVILFRVGICLRIINYEMTCDLLVRVLVIAMAMMAHNRNNLFDPIITFSVRRLLHRLLLLLLHPLRHRQQYCNRVLNISNIHWIKNAVCPGLPRNSRIPLPPNWRPMPVRDIILSDHRHAKLFVVSSRERDTLCRGAGWCRWWLIL